MKPQRNRPVGIRQAVGKAKDSPAPQGWEHVLVRHVVSAKRNDVSRLQSLLRAPFPTSSSGGCCGNASQDVSFYDRPAGRWMITAEFAGERWIALFSNAASGKELFEANAGSRRMEVVWFGCRTQDGGWFFKLNRAGKLVVDFRQGVNDTSPSLLKCDTLKSDFLKGCRSGQAALTRLCEHFDVSRPKRQVRAVDGEFQMLGARGQPVKTGLRGYVSLSGPEIAAGENPAATALAEAIENCDAEGIRKAAAQGASLTVQPDTSISPLQSVLYCCGQAGWEECVETLLELGCPINGLPNEDPPIVDCTSHLISEQESLEMIELLVAHGADVNRQGRNGKTALWKAVVDRRKNIVRYLMEHGADPHIPDKQGRTPVEWLRERIEKEHGFNRRKELNELLSMLTGEPVEQMSVPVLNEVLRRENERFQIACKAQALLGILPSEVRLQRTKYSELDDVESYEIWETELTKMGFKLVGHYEREALDVLVLSAYANPRLSLYAVLSNRGFRSDALRCDVIAYHTDNTVTVMSNNQRLLGRDLDSPSLVRAEHSGENPAQLLSRMAQLKKPRRSVEPSAKSFEQRFTETWRGLLQESRQRTAQVVANPIIVNGVVPRYERLEFFLDFSKYDDPGYSTQKLTESLLKRLTNADLGKSLNLEKAIRSALQLTVMRHLQFAGARKSLEFLTQGYDLALKYFRELAPLKGSVDASQLPEFTAGTLLAALAGRWDTFADICDALTPKFLKADDRCDAPLEYPQLLLHVACTFRRKPFPKSAGLPDAVKKGRPKRPRLLLKVWEAVLANRQAGFEEALRLSLEDFLKQPRSRSNPYDMIESMPLAESLLHLAAIRRGLSNAQLPAPLDDWLITPATIGAGIAAKSSDTVGS